MTILEERTKEFRDRLAQLPREKLLDLIETQDPELRQEVERIEWVFKNKLRHLNWNDGTPVTSKPLTNEELALLIDEPFKEYPELTKMGLNLVEQRKLHIAKDPVLWAKEFLNLSELQKQPRAYQILILRHPNLFKVLRSGRRAGKTFSMAIIALHYAFNTSNGKVIVLTPMKAQGELIYQEIRNFCREAPIVEESITRHVTSPQYSIELSNGSTIRFFSTGMKSGGKSDVTRGQEAHIIILDELDYMGDDDLEAVFAMMQKTAKNQADKQMIGASTPSGRRAVFWHWANDADSPFTEFWFPAYVNPMWDEKQEKFQRSQHSEMGYRHEIEADWGEDVTGVYPHKYVDIAFHGNNWDYIARPVNGDTKYVMGVDWDKYGAGCSFVVLEIYPKEYANGDLAGRYKLVYREETKKEEYTLLNATNRVVQLHQMFQFEHIYVDRGYGEMQVEMLHKYGVDHPISRLDEIVKGISFAESIEVRDPFRMQKEKKEVKPFMVDTLRQMLERQQIKFPEHDEELYMQLISFVVARQTALGRPVFEMSTADVQDHAHDALILACLAIAQNYSDMLKPNYATESYVVSNHAFLNTFDLTGDPTLNQHMEEEFLDKYGSLGSAPVRIRRDGASLGGRAGRRGSVRRGMF